jgi:hypothetical protein
LKHARILDADLLVVSAAHGAVVIVAVRIRIVPVEAVALVDRTVNVEEVIQMPKRNAIKSAIRA